MYKTLSIEEYSIEAYIDVELQPLNHPWIICLYSMIPKYCHAIKIAIYKLFGIKWNPYLYIKGRVEIWVKKKPAGPTIGI